MKDKLLLSTVDPSAGDLARKYGLGLELSEFCTAWNLDDEFPQTDRRVRKEMEGLTLFTLHGPYNELFPCAIDKKARALTKDRFLQTMAVARGYGIHKIIFHAGYNPYLYFPIWFIEQSILFFKDFSASIPGDMTICLENVLEEDPSFLVRILQEVDCPNLRMCLDVGHANAYSKKDPIAWIREAGSWIDHLHIHNNDGTADTHSPLMEGTIPMEELFSQIGLHCPQATMTLELPEAASSLVFLNEHHLL